MSTNSRTVAATPEQVWAVLADGWLYPLWVVGASRMREVDDTWPESGARLHHSVGIWPLLVDDTTEVLECDPGLVPAAARPRLARRRGRGDDQPARRGAETEIVMTEDAVAGPGRLVPKPLRDLPLSWRNVEALRRLAFVVERRG